nr:glycosyltransferase family 2 protein [uncultured Limnohabitans sp.]
MAKKSQVVRKVSVVMPSLNQVQFLEAAVRSVLEQDYPHIELIVADGMSTDGSIELLVRLQAEFGERLRWVSQKDGGAAEALNHAISLAQGAVIGWLNSDDLYAPSAVASAVAHFAKYPTHQMVYGEGQHIDGVGNVLSDYPTQPPSTPLAAFADGSFICQPTVFMRRDALVQVGPLDATIRTAFDFDLFVRFFKRYPRQIGMVPRVQAFSRLHAACMTQRLRRQVALDGMRVVSKELGTVPDHWFWTHVDELCASYPFGPEPLPLVTQLTAFLKEASAFLTPDVLTAVVARLKTDWRLRLATPELFATVQPDGWAPKLLALKYRWTGKPAAAIRLHCNAAWPVAGKLRLKVMTPTGQVQHNEVNVPDDFVLRLEVPQAEQSGCMVWTVETDQGFVPAEHEKGSNDSRNLAFQVTEIRAERQAKRGLSENSEPSQRLSALCGGLESSAAFSADPMTVQHQLRDELH